MLTSLTIEMYIAEATSAAWSGPCRHGLDPNGPPYLGPNGQFSSLHRGLWGRGDGAPITNCIFMDGSVHSSSASISPGVFEALATIAGGEKVQLPAD